MEAASEDVMSKAELGGYSGCVITLVVGSRGIISNTGFSHLKSEFNIHKQDFIKLLTRVSAIALIESYARGQPEEFSTLNYLCSNPV